MSIFGFKPVVSAQDAEFDFAGCPPETVIERLGTTPRGLADEEARKRLREYGPNEPARKKKRTILVRILSMFLNPLVIVLLIIAGFSLFFGEKISALLVVLMAVMSVLLSFVQEYRAGKEAEKLSEMVRPPPPCSATAAREKS
jgi:P-type Mg2+ transporter